MSKVRTDENWPYGDVLDWVNDQAAVLGLRLRSYDGNRINVTGPANQLRRKCANLVYAWYDAWGGSVLIEPRYTAVRLLSSDEQREAAETYRRDVP
jgi:hypothetical protein